MYQITYQKRNGDIFYRIRDTKPSAYIGEETSMGWTVLEIKESFNGKYYSHDEYKRLFDKWKKRNDIEKKLRKSIKNNFPKIAAFITYIFLFRIINF